MKEGESVTSVNPDDLVEELLEEDPKLFSHALMYADATEVVKMGIRQSELDRLEEGLDQISDSDWYDLDERKMDD